MAVYPRTRYFTSLLVRMKLLKVINNDNDVGGQS